MPNIQDNNTWLRKAYTELSMALVNNANIKSYAEPLLQPLFPLWSASDYRAQVKQVRHESQHCYTLVLKPTKKWQGFQPGQYVELHVIKNGAKISRCFSISSAPEQFTQLGTIELTIRTQDKGRITPWLKEALNETSTVGLSAAQGDFIIKDRSRPILMIAGGSGITPFRSYLNSQATLELTQQASLLYFARNQNEHLFNRELNRISDGNKHLNTHLISTADMGHFSLKQLKKQCPNYLDCDIYICGPNSMIVDVNTLLLNAKVNENNIYIERFGPAPVDFSKLDQAGTVNFSQSRKSLELGSNTNLLDLAENNGLQPESGCRMGICHKCSCRKKSGVVYNTLTDSYSDTGQEDIQLCVSVPVGEVTIEL
jgi:ferredoxin-NADP reductase